MQVSSIQHQEFKLGDKRFSFIILSMGTGVSLKGKLQCNPKDSLTTVIKSYVSNSTALSHVSRPTAVLRSLGVLTQALQEQYV